MLVTKPAIQALMTTFSTLYRSAYDETPEWSDDIVTTLTSNTKTQTYGWMTRILKMRRWVGPRRLQNLNTQVYTLSNETYENTIGIDVECHFDLRHASLCRADTFKVELTKRLVIA